MNRPHVSVIIPAYNVEGYLAECLDSVLRQTYRDYELIVVDDGSTDRTVEVARRYGDDLRLIQQPNRGMSGARNTGIRASRGELIAFLDADDVWLPEYLEEQMETYKANGGDCLVFCDVYAWDGRRLPTETSIIRGSVPFDASDPLLSIIRGYPLPIDGVLLPRRVLLEVGLFSEQVQHGEDVNLWRRLAMQGVRFCHTPRPLALYRQRPDSLSNARRRESAENLARALARLQHDRGLPPHVRRAAAERARGLPRRFAWLATEAFLQGEYAEAHACWMAAARARPWNPLYGLGAALAKMSPRALRYVVTWVRHPRPGSTSSGGAGP